MTVINATAYRDGKWWAVEVPIDGHVYGTQGRTLKEARFMAKDLVSLMARELNDLALEHAEVHLEPAVDEMSAAQAAREAQREAAIALRHAEEANRKAVISYRQAGLTNDDIAALLDLSRNRVSQLAKA